MQYELFPQIKNQTVQVTKRLICGTYIHRIFPNLPIIKVTYMHSVGPGSVVGIATGYGLDGPGIESRWGARFSAPVQTGPGAHPASCSMGTGSFSRVKSGRGVTLTPHPLLVPCSWKGRAIPLLPLWAVRPVQSLSACTKMHFTYLYVHSGLLVYTVLGLKHFSPGTRSTLIEDRDVRNV